MNIEETARDVMEHEFHYWKNDGNGMFVSYYGDVNGINRYSVDATRRGFISTHEFENIPKGFVKPDSYIIESVVFEDDYNIFVMVVHQHPHIEDVYTEIHISSRRCSTKTRIATVLSPFPHQSAK